MTYFENCKTAEELRKEFHRLMDDIRGMFGSDTVDTTAQPTLA